MVRAFRPDALASGLIDELLDLARRAPAAGNSAAIGFTVLDQPEAVARYWDTTLPAERRGGFRWQQLLDAPVLVLLTTRPGEYVSRYGEEDKAKTGLGRSTDVWPVPYWWVDAGAVAQNLLLLCIDAGLGACLFGAFDHEPALRREFGIAEDVRLVATIAVGHPLPDEPGRSAQRGRTPIAELIHRPD